MPSCGSPSHPGRSQYHRDRRSACLSPNSRFNLAYSAIFSGSAVTLTGSAIRHRPLHRQIQLPLNLGDRLIQSTVIDNLNRLPRRRIQPEQPRLPLHRLQNRVQRRRNSLRITLRRHLPRRHHMRRRLHNPPRLIPNPRQLRIHPTPMQSSIRIRQLPQRPSHTILNRRPSNPQQIRNLTHRQPRRHHAQRLSLVISPSSPNRNPLRHAHTTPKKMRGLRDVPNTRPNSAHISTGLLSFVRFRSVSAPCFGQE